MYSKNTVRMQVVEQQRYRQKANIGNTRILNRSMVVKKTWDFWQILLESKRSERRVLTILNLGGLLWPAGTLMVAMVSDLRAGVPPSRAIAYTKNINS